MRIKEIAKWVFDFRDCSELVIGERTLKLYHKWGILLAILALVVILTSVADKLTI